MRIVYSTCAVAVMVWLAAAPATAGALARQVERVPQRVQFDGLPWKRDAWLYVPNDYDKTRRYALVVVLHPAGLRGHRFAKIWGQTADRTGKFIVLAPECLDAKKRLWAPGDEALVLGTVKRCIAVMPCIDANRVLLTGFSQGGNYVYTFGLRNPRSFRAIAVASGSLVARPSPQADAILQQARHLPVYVVHGAADTHVSVQRARASRDRLEKAGLRVTYQERPHLAHFFAPGEGDRIWAWFEKSTAQPAAPKR